MDSGTRTIKLHMLNKGPDWKFPKGYGLWLKPEEGRRPHKLKHDYNHKYISKYEGYVVINRWGHLWFYLKID